MSMDMESLIRGQVELQGRIARMVENLKKMGAANITVEAIDTRLQRLDSCWEKFDRQHDELRTRHWEATQRLDYIKCDFVSQVEETYMHQRTQLMTLRASFEPRQIAGEIAIPSEPAHPRQRTTLPRIQLPHFSGKYEDWPPFRDLFQSVVGRDDSISQVEKLHYLKVSLKGEAEALIRNLTTVAENYQRAWNTFAAHYENQRLLVRAYLSAFAALIKMKGESASELKRILQCVITTVSSLESIERPISSSENLFVHMTTELLDARSRHDWKDAISATSEPPSFNELKDFLERRLHTLEALHPTKSEANAKVIDSTARSA